MTTQTNKNEYVYTLWDKSKTTQNKSDIDVDQTETATSLIGLKDKYLLNTNNGTNYLVLRDIDGLMVGG